MYYAYFDDLSTYPLFQTFSPLRVSTGKELSYDCARQIVKLEAGKLGLDSSNFSTHCLRSGGMSAGVAKGMSERLLQLQGRLQSDSCKNLYAEETVSRRLLLSIFAFFSEMTRPVIEERMS